MAISRRALIAGSISAFVAGAAVAFGGPSVEPLFFYKSIILPTIAHLEQKPERLGPLLLGTALVESNLNYVKQVMGPARGYFQMEPATHDDLWATLKRNGLTKIEAQLRALLPPGTEPNATFMTTNADYACGCAVVYYQACHLYRAKLPAHGDVPGQAAYWKRWWNTPAGAGTVERYLSTWAHFNGSEIVG